MRIFGQPFLGSRLGPSLCVPIVLLAALLVLVLMARFAGSAGH